MRRADGVLAASLAALVATGAIGRDPAGQLAIPAEPLDRAVLTLGSALGLSVGLGPGVPPNLPARPVRGRVGGREALARLTRGLPVVVVEIDASTFRIDARPVVQHPAGMRPPPERPVTGQANEIVVTADKRGEPLDRLPATFARIDGRSIGAADQLAGSNAVVDTLTSIGSTALGAGRNKLFLRGVADSSFNGLSQSTSGQYFGEARLTYNAPDPNLLLADIASVEVLEGPQGTLYGAGALGGVIRVVPHPVRLDRVEGALAVGLSDTAHGAPGDDVTAVLNLPLRQDRIGARLVVYRSVEGGYIDDTERGLAGINRTVLRGGRLSLLGDLPGGWSIEGGAIYQDIDAEDGQYAEQGQPPLTRRSAIAQPFDNDYRLGDVVVRGAIGAATLVSTTSVVDHHVNSTYDFTSDPATPREFQERNAISLIAHETRLARNLDDGGGWLIGLALLRENDRLIRTLGSVPDPMRITGVRNITYEGAIYGERTLPLTGRLQATVGARASLDRLSGEGLDPVAGEQLGSHRDSARLVPLLALSWRPRADLLVFARYAQGYRPGGLSVAGESDLGAGTAAPERFRDDQIGTAETGMRATAFDGALSGSLTLAYARWRHIQADLVSTAGFPYTANIGTGRILSTEASLVAKPMGDLRLEAALTLERGHLVDADLPIADPDDRNLPNVPKVGARLGADWHRPLGGDWAFDLRASARYYGRSRLGAGDVLDVSQGNYVDTRVGVRFGTPRLAVTVDLSNLRDSRGNRFAFGNPFDVATRAQITPMRPRTVRLGMEAHF